MEGELSRNFLTSYQNLRNTLDLSTLVLILYSYNSFDYVENLQILAGVYIMSTYSSGLDKLEGTVFEANFKDIIGNAVYITQEIEASYTALSIFSNGINNAVKESKEAWPTIDYLRLSISGIEISTGSGSGIVDPSGFLQRQVYIFLANQYGGSKLAYSYESNAVRLPTHEKDRVIEQKCLNSRNLIIFTHPKIAMGFTIFFMIINLTLLTLFSVYIYRNHKSLSFTSFGASFYVLLTLALLLLTIAPVFFFKMPTKVQDCNIRMGYIDFGVSFLFSVIFMRTIRLFLFTQIKRLKTLTYSFYYMIISIICCLFITLLFSYILILGGDMKYCDIYNVELQAIP